VARTYRQDRRGASAEDTRERIVHATFALHAEQGIAGTSMKQIAARAGVSVGSVYHHFPTYEDAVRACGLHAYATAPPPDAAIFAGADGRAERVRRLALAFFRFFEGVRAFASVRADAPRLPMLQPLVDQERAGRLALAELAAGPDAAPALAALVDVGAWEAFTRAGFTTDEAAARAAEIANAWLDASHPQKEP
jgi:AcrR family transcriptional regulator